MSDVTADIAVTLTSRVEVVDVSRGVVTLRLGGIEHRIRAGGYLIVNLSWEGRAS